MVAQSLGETPPEQRITALAQVLWPGHDPLFPRALAAPGARRMGG
jgi:hypothetical protein